MAGNNILRGKVTAYPNDTEKGLVEVSIGTYDEAHNTVFARAEQSMSGVYWLPEIGDVVEVEVPHVSGYEARIIHIHRPADDEQGGVCWSENNNIKQIKTRTGHTITLDDTKDTTAITLQTAGGLKLQMDDEAQSVTFRGPQNEPMLMLDMKENIVKLISSNNLILTCADSFFEIDSNGNISIEAKGNLKLSGKEISLEAKSKLTAKGQQIEVSGSAGTKISGKSQMEVSSGGVTQVKGSIIKLN